MYTQYTFEDVGGSRASAISELVTLIHKWCYGHFLVMKDRGTTIHPPNFVWKGRIIYNSLTSIECFYIIFIQQFITLTTLEGRTDGRGNHAFWYQVTSCTLNKSNMRIGSQSTMEDLFFPPWMNSCTFVLQAKILCHSLDTKRPCRRLRVNIHWGGALLLPQNQDPPNKWRSKYWQCETPISLLNQSPLQYYN